MQQTDLTIIARDNGLPRDALRVITGPERGLREGVQMVMRAVADPERPLENFAQLGSYYQQDAAARAATENLMHDMGVKRLHEVLPPMYTADMQETAEPLPARRLDKPQL